MKMKKFLNDPNTLTDELLQGYALAASDLIDVEGHHRLDLSEMA